MYAITMNRNNGTETVSFEKYYDLLRYVAHNTMNGTLKDEDFRSLQFGEDEIVGMGGLCSYALDKANEMEQFEQMMEAMMSQLGADESDEDFE